MPHQAIYTVSVWGGWYSSTLSNYDIRAERGIDALEIAQARFVTEHGHNRINAVWVLRAKGISTGPEELA